LREDATRLVSDVTPDPVREDDYARLKQQRKLPCRSGARSLFLAGSGALTEKANHQLRKLDVGAKYHCPNT
jgi:hypothetical protein